MNSFIKSFSSFNFKFSSGIEWVAITGLNLMMMITVVDVIGSKVFFQSIPGSVDLVSLAMVVALTFAIAMTQIEGRHVKVEFFMDKSPKMVSDIVGILISLAMVFLFVMICWQSFKMGIAFAVSGQISNTAKVPLAPLAFGMAFTAIPVSLIFFQEFLGHVYSVVKR